MKTEHYTPSPLPNLHQHTMNAVQILHAVGGNCMPSALHPLPGNLRCVNNLENGLINNKRTLNQGVRRKDDGRLCRRSLCVRAQRGGPSGNKESKQVLDAFFLGKAVAEAVSERVGSALGELLSEIGQRQAEQQRRFREFQDEVQERARNAELKAAQKALAKEASPASQNRTSSISDDYEKPTTDSANGLPSLPYKDLPPLEPPPEGPTPSSGLPSLPYKDLPSLEPPPESPTPSSDLGSPDL